MYESIDAGVSAALAGSATGVADTQNAISSVGMQLEKKLDSALASGNQGDVLVELTALYNFYNELKQTWAELDAADKKLSSASLGEAVDSIVDDIGSIFGERIPGIEAALQAAHDNMSPSSPGLMKTVTDLKNLVAHNLAALAATYTAYREADVEGASELSKATGSALDNQWKDIDAGIRPKAPAVPAWARSIVS